MTAFDDARLDDPEVLAEHDPLLRQLALAGSRIRVEAGPGVFALDAAPRGVVVIGQESRLVRAVIETTCPVPLVAWAFGGLPGWVGPLDLVVALAPRGEDTALLGSVLEAVRRGCMLLVAAPDGSAVAEASAARGSHRVATRTGDPLAAAVVLLQLLHMAGLGPQVAPEMVARAADMAAEDASPHKDLSANPAKDMALSLADAQPLVCGTSVLAARAARRVAEALRRHSGRAALAADARELLPVVRGAARYDPFADPDEDGPLAPALVVLDDGDADQRAVAGLEALEGAALDKQLRVVRLRCFDPDAGAMDRYVSLLIQGFFGAAYLGLGLGTAAGPQQGLWEPGR